MYQIDDYINRNFKHVKGNYEEISVLKEEIRTHLIETVMELQAEGKTLDESTSIAIKRFDENNELKCEITSIFGNRNHPGPSIKRLTTALLVITIIPFILLLLFKINISNPGNVKNLKNIDSVQASKFTIRKTSVYNNYSAASKIIIYTPHPYETYTNNYDSV